MPAQLPTDIDLPVCVRVPGGHTAMNGASCREDTHEQVYEQPSVSIDSGGWPHVCSSGDKVWAGVSSESCGQSLASSNLMGSHRIPWGGVPGSDPRLWWPSME